MFFVLIYNFAFDLFMLVSVVFHWTQLSLFKECILELFLPVSDC